MSTASPPFAQPVAEPSPSQRRAIEARPGPLLVLAGPGAGKTFCLTERIRFLIERCDFDPARICAFTFTNKAAGEIAHRLETRLGSTAERITRGTIHAFCAERLRELGTHVGLEAGFGIADEEYQLGVLRRLEGPRRWHRSTLTRFSAHRFRGDEMFANDLALFERYERYLGDRNLVDFDTLVVKAAELLELSDAAPEVRARWDVVLVDEFQDLNPVQYRVISALARDHRHVFAVGDDEQSIYSWAGADPAVFRSFVNDFGITAKVHLEENRRCPHDVFALARRLVTINTPIFDDRVVPRADRESAFPIRIVGFGTDEEEASWIVDDLRCGRIENAHRWGDVALLYRRHEIGDLLETACLNAGIPCRLALGRALSEDPVVGYVIAAAHVIANPTDDLLRDAYFRVVLERPLFDEARAKAEEGGIDLLQELRRMAAQRPRADETGRQIRRALANWRNLEAVGKQHSTLTALVADLLSRRVGKVRSVLDDRHDEISDPASLRDVVALAARLRRARAARAEVRLPPMVGVDIALKGMLAEIGIRAVRAGQVATRAPAAASGERHEASETIGADDVPSVGLALGLFKAAQLIEMADSSAEGFTSFTALDLETTDRDTKSAQIVEIAAVRVRDSEIVDRFSSLVKPRVPIAAGAAETHGIHEADLVDQPLFEEIWPAIRDFCGEDIVVAHNGYDFDFPLLKRMVNELGQNFELLTFDSLPLARDLFPTSRKLVDLARHFEIPPGQSHRALDDTVTLAKVLLKLGEMKLSRARKTALSDLLANLGVALALCDEKELPEEARLFRQLTVLFALGRYTNCLEWYERERDGDPSIPDVNTVIDQLGGPAKMAKIRADKTADERYPAAMTRIRRLIAQIPEGTLEAQLSVFLERAVLSKFDGLEPERERVNLLTLHSTKGLEFSRVYIVGVEDALLPGGPPGRNSASTELEEARRLLYVGMTRTVDRLVLTRVATRGGKDTGGHRFLDEMGLVPEKPA